MGVLKQMKEEFGDNLKDMQSTEARDAHTHMGKRFSETFPNAVSSPRSGRPCVAGTACTSF